MDAPPAGKGPPTVAGLADLQAEAHKEAFANKDSRKAARRAVPKSRCRWTGWPACSTTWHGRSRCWTQEVERELLTLAMALARQIVRRELKTDPTQIIGIIREAIAALPVAAREVRVHLHPGGCGGGARASRAHRSGTRLGHGRGSGDGARRLSDHDRDVAHRCASGDAVWAAILSELLGTERHAALARPGAE